jgi:hypothetical protein
MGGGRIMDGDWKSNWESMTIDDLSVLREQVHEILRERLKAKQAELERRLQALAPVSTDVESTKGLGRRRVNGAHA